MGILKKRFNHRGGHVVKHELNNPRGCYVQAFKEGYIEDINVWNDILLSRNSTAHIYDEEDYEQIKNNIIDKYIEAIEKLVDKIGTQVI